MRKDIEIDLQNNDINLIKRPPAYSSDLKWVSEDDEYVYGECVLQDHLNFTNLNRGIGLLIPQKDSTKKIKIRFAMIDYKDNKIDTGYLIVKDLDNKELIGSKLPLISDEFYFRIYLEDEFYLLTNGYNTDLSVEESKEQNEYLILVANKGNLYNSPLSGVEINKFLNGDILKSGIETIIQREMEIDGMVVNAIKYDINTGDLDINTEEI